MSTETAESGSSVIRRALASRNRKLNLAGMARDLAVPSTALEAFACGDAKLAPEILVKLAERIWHGHLKYDPLTDTLQSANTSKPTSTGVPPPRPAPKPPHPGGVPPQYGHGGGAPQIERPGWIKW
jgi:hypothetical protein